LNKEITSETGSSFDFQSRCQDLFVLVNTGCQCVFHAIRLVGLAITVLFLISFSANTFASNAPLPNVVIFFSDDAGYGDFGFQNSPTHLTPWIDKLAAAGTMFTQAYASSSVCSPSRAGLLTGRYQNRFGIEYNLPTQISGQYELSKAGLPQSEITLADLVKSKGYHTAMIGKWHLGENTQFLPDKRGFDKYFGLMGGSSGYHTGKARKIVSNYRNVDTSTLPYLTDALGDEAVAFVKENKDRPFFLYFPFNAPHGPLHAKPEYLNKYKKQFANRKRAANAALTQSMDENIGKVLGTLSQLGLKNNTLVIFANDNGGQDNQNGASNQPLNGTKGTVLEGGIRIPMIISWPQELPAGKRYDEFVSTLDILPTVAKALDLNIPAELIYDGVDLLPYLRGEIYQPPHETLFWQVNWASAVRHKNWKLIHTPANDTLLFDLDSDITESHDLSLQHPEIVEHLNDKLNRWQAQMSSPLWTPEEKWKRSAQSLYH